MSKMLNHIGVAISDKKIKIVELINRNNEYMVKNIDEIYFNKTIDWAIDKETKIVSEIQNAFDELALKTTIDSDNISFALPAGLFNSIHIPYDNSLTDDDLRNELNWEVSLLSPNTLQSDFLTQAIPCEQSVFNKSNTIIALGLNKKYLNIINSFASRNSLSLKYIDNCHFASDNSLFANNTILNDSVVLSVYISDNYLSITLYFKQKLLFYKNFELTNLTGMTDILADVCNVIKPLEVETSQIDYYFIAGDDLSAGKINLINQKSGLALQLFNPFRNLQIEESLISNPLFSETNFNFTSAAGISIRA